jgi:regulator of nonsense transcripts 2
LDERAPSPEEQVVLSASNSLQENIGPSEEDEAEFAKELAKLVTDTSAESRKVDKKTALALWDSAVLPPNIRKKRQEDDDESSAPQSKGQDVMNFAVVTKRGNKQQVGSSCVS